jgi:hypothetical protein
MRFQLPTRPNESDVLLAGLHEAAEAAQVPPDAPSKVRARIVEGCKVAARRKWNDAEAAWKIACDEVRVAARAEIEALRTRAQAVRADATTRAAAIEAEATTTATAIEADATAIEKAIA